jgi:thymidylate synthase
VPAKAEHETVELMFYSFQLGLWKDSIDYWQHHVKPNLPWAEDHFLERVAGRPDNPGVEWRNWPFHQSADTFRNADGQFSHTYMERYWTPPIDGIRYRFGDLNDVVNLLDGQPHTRQAFLPVWFPEDTGVVHQGRVPCTLGYHFIMRNKRLSIVYYIRSCDYIRHFRDDVYMTIRLLIWMLTRLRERSSVWNDVMPGSMVMHITSLHMFINDFILFLRTDDDAEKETA